MDQKEIFEILQSSNNLKRFDDLSSIHLSTKHYLLLAEELSEEGVAFLQPLKEHRDAYDHLMRIFALPHRDIDWTKNEVQLYIEDNLKKAYGHAYRAFFDTADWLTYICRKYIREALSRKVIKDKYITKYSYDDAKKIINEVPARIAEYREKKDISNTSTITEVERYKDTLDKLLEIYRNICDLQ